MWTAVFAITTIICAIGWLSRYISCMAILYYIAEKGYKLPNDDDITECTYEVVKHLFK